MSEVAPAVIVHLAAVVPPQIRRDPVRFAWELVIGPIPRGMELGYRNASRHHSANPDHWALVTDQQNATYSAAHPSPADRRWRTTQRLSVIDGCHHNHGARGVPPPTSGVDTRHASPKSSTKTSLGRVLGEREKVQ